MNTLDTIFEDSIQESEKSNIIQGRSLYKCKSTNIIKDELYILEFLKITNKHNFLKNSENNSLKNNENKKINTKNLDKKVNTTKLNKKEIINNLKKVHGFTKIEIV